MTNPPICLDANLVIRLVVDVHDNRIQGQWEQWATEQRQLLAPALLWYEVTNALYQYHKHNILVESMLGDALTTALLLPVQIIADANLHPRALALAQQFNLPATYDAHYLALAEQVKAEFWTTDKKLVTAVSPILPWIHLWA